MRLTVLVDNNTLIDRYFLAEPGVAFLIETDGRKVLFDTGYSDIFMQNAVRLGIDLFDVDAVVLSHSHLDHTGGLHHLIKAHAERRFENLPLKRPTLIAHPSVFERRVIPGLGDIGCMVSEAMAGQYFDLTLTRDPYWLSPSLVFLGEIERANDFEANDPIGKLLQGGAEADDYLADDTSLACKTAGGLVIVSGCAHAGICNTVNQAMRICNDTRLVDIVGGFHLLEPTQRQLNKTVEQIGRWRPGALHACHCTDLKSRLALSRVADLKEVGVGLLLGYE